MQIGVAVEFAWVNRSYQVLLSTNNTLYCHKLICMTRFLLFFLTGLISLPLTGQPLTREEIQDASRDQFNEAMAEYRSFLAIPNTSRDKENIQRNVEWCLDAFQKRGFDTQRIVAEDVPHVFAELHYGEELETILFYLQIDGQPVDPREWDQPDPFTPVLKRKEKSTWQTVSWTALEEGPDPDLRIFARSASDSKGPAMAFIAALDILAKRSLKAPFNIKVIMDFQEEIGSPALPGLVKTHRDLLQADMMLIMDGTRHLSNLPTLTFGARGIATMTLTVYGAERNLHSGQYGNFAPNPVFKLSRLLAGMKDENGRVTIPGYYDNIGLSGEEKQILNSVPEDMEEINTMLGIAEAEKVGETYQEALQYPSLNVRGLRAGWVREEVRTLIPSEAVAEIDIRLVPETEGERIVQLVRDYIKRQGFYITDAVPTASERKKFPDIISITHRIGSRPFRTDMQSDLAVWLEKAMYRVFGNSFIKMRTTGGSQPIAPFIHTLGIPAVAVRIPNPDNNIHGPNENLRIGNFLEGIQTCLGILTQPVE